MALNCDFGRRAGEVFFPSQNIGAFLEELRSAGIYFKERLNNVNELLNEIVLAKQVIDDKVSKHAAVVAARNEINANIRALDTVNHEQALPGILAKKREEREKHILAPVFNLFERAKSFLASKLLSEDNKVVIDRKDRLMAFNKVALESDYKRLTVKKKELQAKMDRLEAEVTKIVHMQETAELEKQKQIWSKSKQDVEAETDAWISDIEKWVQEADAFLNKQLALLQAEKDQAVKLCQAVQTRVAPEAPAPPKVERVEINQKDADFMEKLATMTSDKTLFPMYPMPPSEPGVGRCDFETGDELQASDYQQSFGFLGHRLIVANWLMYWAPGSGKTNAINFYVQRFVLSMLEKPPGSSVEEVVVVVHTESEISKYTKGYEKTMYCLPEFRQKIVSRPVDKSKQQDGDKHAVTEFMSVDDPGRVIARVRVSYMGNKFLKTGKEFDNVKRVLIDEAHYMFAWNEAFQNESWWLKDLETRPHIKKVYCTGTPTSNDDHPIRIFRMLATLTEGIFDFKQYHLNRNQVIEGWIETPAKMKGFVDEDAYNKPAKKIMANFFVPDTKPPKWVEGKKEFVQSIARKFVSYVTLENDSGVYPRKSGPRDMSGPFASLRSGGTITFHNGQFTGPVPGTDNIVQVNVVTAKESKSSSTNGGNSFRKTAKDSAYPIKFSAIEALIELNPGKKCFLFTPLKYDKGVFNPLLDFLQTKGYTPFYVMDFQANVPSNLGENKYSATAKETALNDLWKKSKSEFVESFYSNPNFRPAKRFIALDDRHRKWSPYKDLFKMMLEVANDPRNLHGDYIRLVIGARSAREGLNMMDIPIVIFSFPTSSGSEYRQAVARAMRLCSFKATSPTDITHWLVSAYVLVSVNEKREYIYGEGELLAKMHIPSESGMIETTLQQSAFDCFKNSRLGFVCDGAPGPEGKFVEPEEVVTCFSDNPSEGSSRVPMKSCKGLVNPRRYSALDEVVAMCMEKRGEASAVVVISEPVKVAIEAALASSKAPEDVFKEIVHPLNEEQFAAFRQQWMQRRRELSFEEQQFVQQQARDYLAARNAYERALKLRDQFQALSRNDPKLGAFQQTKDNLEWKVSRLETELVEMRSRFMGV